MLESQSREVTEVTRSDRWLHVAVDPLRNPQGALRGALGIISDVTERRRMEEELRHRAEELATADRRKNEFLAMLAHELRNPLAPILNCLGLIRQESSEGQPIGPSLEIAERQVKHMARLLDDLLDVSRFIQGKIQLQKSPVDFARVVAHAVETSTPLIQAKKHRLVLNLPAEPVTIQGDSTRLAQVVANLLNNAAKYTEPGGEITLTADCDGEELTIRVKDTGIGLSEDMLGRVFDLFTQADLSLDRSQGGLGIGLTLVRSLVELHGGSISVRSPGLGLGSEFIVQVPARFGPSTARPETPPPPARQANEHLRILVVDDHLDSATSLARLLKSWGHRTRVVHDGPAVIDALSTDTFDVVLLDIGLPGMSGYEVAARIRDSRGGDRIVLVALTGYGQEQDQRRSAAAGFDRHLVKPVIPDTLNDLLTNVQGLRSQADAAGTMTDQS
jgi:two-component system CheB/CheR fusion protein